MRVIVLSSPQAVSLRAADLIARLVTAKPKAVLGLAAGATPVGLYHELGARCAAGRLDLSGVTAFPLDEYLGLPATHPALLVRCFETHLLAASTLRPDALRRLDSQPAAGPFAACAAHEDAIAAAGGIDLQILGIGGNGHIGFNEPGSSLAGRTHVVCLSEATRRANAGAFPPGEAVPEAAMTMGIGTIREARRILLLATGASKAAAVAAAIEGPVTASVPASALQLHPDVTVMLDEAAAANLAQRARFDAEAHLLDRLEAP